MKKLILIIITCYASTFGMAQSLPKFGEINLDTPADCQKADPQALTASNFLFDTPFNKDNPDRLHSLQFIIKWMTGTPDYQFTLDEITTKITKGNDDLMGLYMAAMTKYSLENKANAKDTDVVRVNSVKALLRYCENEKNNLPLTKQLKKLLEAEKKGTLEKELK